MDKLPENVTCGPAREIIRNFLRKQPEERNSLSEEEQTRTALAFHHMEMCWHGNDMANFCNDLWKELQTMTRESNEDGDKNTKYDPDVVKYLLFAQFPLHDTEGINDNPLKNLDW